jgi:transcriptional regulator with GAF, ATPase, and Fis domain
MPPSGNPPDGRDAGGGGEPQALREQIAENQRTIDRLNRDLSSRSNDVRTIQQISTEITSSLDLDEVLVIVLGAMQRILGFEHSMILLKDLAAEKLRVFASRGYETSGAGAEVALSHGVVGAHAYCARRPYVLLLTGRRPRPPGHDELAAQVFSTPLPAATHQV